MKTLRAIKFGALLWGFIFVEWSIIMFAPVLKDLGQWQFVLHYLVLIPLVMICAKWYYQKKDKTNGFLLGVVFLLTGIVLDAIITVPLFIGGDYSFFTSWLMLVGYAELILVVGLYKLLKK